MTPTPQPTPDGFFPAIETATLPPGTGRSCSLQGRTFAIYHLDGRFAAIDDACPHRGASLGEGHAEGPLIHCPLHGWAFHAFTGTCQSNPNRPVKTHETRIDNGWVWVRPNS